eukprot:scaffold55002_cov34-Phaeocystis_antarctica.AAC.1
MQWVRAACVRPASSMRVCARSYLGRASIAKTVVDILQQLQIQTLSYVPSFVLPLAWVDAPRLCSSSPIGRRS